MTVVKVTDFGIAKMAKSEIEEAFKNEETITGSQTVMGALPYMAPEMVSDPKEAKLSADVWAAGAILYRLIAGVTPFGTGLGAVPKILEAKTPGKPKLFGRKPQFELLENELWDILTACLNKDSAKRPDADSLVSMCARLCYSDAPRYFGTIFAFGRSYGFWGKISGDGGNSVFFHLNSFYGDKPVEGSRVNFARFAGAPHPRAFPVLQCRT
jgi:serine/threonine-protein kinase